MRKIEEDQAKLKPYEPRNSNILPVNTRHRKYPRLQQTVAHFHSQDSEFLGTRRDDEQSRRDVAFGLQGGVAAFYVAATSKKEAVSKKNVHLKDQERRYPLPMKVTPTNERRELSICDNAHSRYILHLSLIHI